MEAGYGYPATGGERGKLRAADVDRDRVAAVLNAAYADGRLSKDEYDARLESALSARTYADLDQVVSDLPALPASRLVPSVTTSVNPVPATNGMAIASFACGLGQFVVGPLATVPAIVLGHMARSQIRRTGEHGAGLALAGLALGWAAVILAAALLVAALTVLSWAHPSMPMHLTTETGRVRSRWHRRRDRRPPSQARPLQSRTAARSRAAPR